MLEKVVLTNNPLVRDTFEKTIYVDNCVEGLLVKVRDMVYEGYPLLSHPLPASMRMIYSPYRSVMIGASKGKPDAMHAEIAETSLLKYRQNTNHRTPDRKNDEDYKRIDIQLLSVALSEPISL